MKLHQSHNHQSPINLPNSKLLKTSRFNTFSKMAKFISAISILLVVLISGYSQARTCNLQDEIAYTRLINAQLCQAGAHPNAVAQQFFNCYNENITPGGTKFVECQRKVYGALMNTKENIDAVCAAPQAKFRFYATCIMTKLIASGRRPSNTMNKLNDCQGAAVGVARPQ